MISRWERGTRHPRPRYVRLLCELFDLPADQLGLVGETDLALVAARDSIHSDVGGRKDFLQEMASMLSLAPLPPFLRPAPGGRGPAPRQPWECLDRRLPPRR